MSEYDPLNPRHVADNFIKQIDDGWGEDVVREDISELARMLMPMQNEIARLRAEVERMKAERDEAIRALQDQQGGE